MALVNLPDLVRIDGRWVLSGFTPTQPAFMWDEFRGRTGTLYVVGYNGFHKIGISREFDRRFAQIQAGLPTKLERVATRTVPLAGMAYAEAWLHQQHKDARALGEWFAIDRETAVALLSKAVVRAKAYNQHCADWWHRDRAKWQAKHLADAGAPIGGS